MSEGIVCSQEFGEVAKALLAARREFPVLVKDAANPAYRSRYATLAQVLAVVEEPLAKHGLVLVCGCASVDASACVVTGRLIHAPSAQWIESRVRMPLVGRKEGSLPDAQTVGSAITYGRRYLITAMLGLAAEDDDGNAASGHERDRQPARPKWQDRVQGPAPAPAPAPAQQPASPVSRQDMIDAIGEWRQLMQIDNLNQVAAVIAHPFGVHRFDEIAPQIWPQVAQSLRVAYGDRQPGQALRRILAIFGGGSSHVTAQ